MRSKPTFTRSAATPRVDPAAAGLRRSGGFANLNQPGSVLAWKTSVVTLPLRIVLRLLLCVISSGNVTRVASRLRNHRSRAATATPWDSATRALPPPYRHRAQPLPATSVCGRDGLV